MNSYNLPLIPLPKKGVKRMLNPCPLVDSKVVCTCGCCVQDVALVEPAICGCKSTVCNNCKSRKRRRIVALTNLGLKVPVEKITSISSPVPLQTPPSVGHNSSPPREVEPHEPPAKFVFVADEYTQQLASIQAHTTASVLYSLDEPRPGSTTELLPGEFRKKKRYKNRKKHRRSNAEIELNEEIQQLSNVIEFNPPPSFEEAKKQQGKKLVESMEVKKARFFSVCAKEFKELSEGLYIVPTYTENSGKAKCFPVIVSWYNFTWTCSCKLKTSVGVYVGKSCWHEEWVIAKVAKALQTEITRCEQASTDVAEKDVAEASSENSDQEREQGDVNDGVKLHINVEDEENERSQEEVGTEISKNSQEAHDVDNDSEDSERESIEKDMTDKHLVETEEDSEGDATQPRKRSEFHRREQDLLQMATTQGRSKRSSHLPTTRVLIPRTTVSLAMTDQGQNIYVSIESRWEEEKVVDKRLNVDVDRYQYLVKFKGWGNNCNMWKFPKDISDPTLIAEFEERRTKQINEKRHVASWYPFADNLVIQWKDHPFFIVSYGGGQMNKFCVVGLNKTGTALKCKRAHHPNQSHHQVHVELVKREMVKLNLRVWKKSIEPIDQNHPEEEEEEEQDSISEAAPKPISQTPICVLGAKDVQLTRLNLQQNMSILPPEFKPKTHPSFCKCESDVVVDGEVAKVCKGRYKEASEPLARPPTLWVTLGPPITDRKAYVWKCKSESPSCNVYFDGHEEGIFNYSNVTMVTHAVMFEFLFGLISGKGDTFDGYVNHKALMNRFCFGWNGTTEVAFLQKSTFIKVVLAFLNLIEPESTPMCCALCGPYPKWMGFDGVSLAMSKEQVLWDTVETILPKNSETTPLDPTVLKQRNRMLLSNIHTRKQLAVFCTSKPAAMRKEEFFALTEVLAIECPSLATLLTTMYVEEVQRNDPVAVYNYSFPGIWKDFLLLLSSATSMAWILRPDIIPLILHLAHTRKYTADAHRLLSTFCPPLAIGLSYAHEGNIKPEMATLLLAAVDIVKGTYPNMEFESAVPDTVTAIPDTKHRPPTQQQGSQGAWLDHLKKTVDAIQQAHIPISTGYDHSILNKNDVVPEMDNTLTGMAWSFPRVRVLPRFEGVDPLPQTTVGEWSDSHNLEESELFCQKEERHSYARQKHTAGLFVGSCLHAVCYGFHSMVAPEGRKDLLKVLYERFPQQVLDNMNVLYDFNCQEAEYMLNRVPEMVAHVRLFIDRWHAASHKCAGVFKFQTYSAFQELPSTGSESLNFFLQRFHGQTPFMKQTTCILFNS